MYKVSDEVVVLQILQVTKSILYLPEYMMTLPKAQPPFAPVSSLSLQEKNLYRTGLTLCTIKRYPPPFFFQMMK